jgi:hypothetical protein
MHASTDALHLRTPTMSLPQPNDLKRVKYKIARQFSPALARKIAAYEDYELN